MIMPMALWWPYGGGLFLMSEVLLYGQDRANFRWDSPLDDTVPTGCLQKGLGLLAVGTMDYPGSFTKTLGSPLRFNPPALTPLLR